MWGQGWKIITHSLRIFQKYPVFIVPIIFVWLLYAPTIIYLKYFFSWKQYDVLTDLGVLFGEIFFFSLIILISATMVLEMIQQLERKEEVSLIRALFKTFEKDIIKVIPLALIWAIIWFILTVIEILLSKSKDRDNDSLSAENAAKTLAGYNNFSFSRAFIDALEKGVRMVVFLILPTIAWENLGLFGGIKKGFSVLKAHLAEFASGYALTYAAAMIVFLPPAIIFELGTGRHGNPPPIQFPDSVWTGVIIYIGLAWSFCMYLEQMFMANLYLWHLSWEKAMATAKEEGKPLPSFSQIPQPNILEGTAEFLQPTY